VGRSRKQRDELYAEYEGLVIQAANDLWGTWAGGLAGTAVGLDDLCQEARAILLELCGTMDMRMRPERRRAWVGKSVRGRLLNLIKAKVYPKVQTVQADLTNISLDSESFPADLPEISLTFSRDEREFCQCMLAGDTEAEARRAVGWSKAEAAEALGRMRRAMEREGWT